MTGWRMLGLSAFVAAAVAAVLVLGIRSGTDHAVEMSTSAGKYGFVVEMPISFGTSRSVVSGTFHADGRDYAAGFYNGDGLDEEHPAMPMQTHGGDHLLVHSLSLAPSCDGASPTPPVLTVVTEGLDGERVVDKFAATNPEDYVEAVREWCSLPIHAAVPGATLDRRHQHASYQLQLFNTTSSPIRVTSKEFQHQSSHWAEASVLVPPRGRSMLRVSVDGPQWRPSPWSVGLLEADGQVIQLGR